MPTLIAIDAAGAEIPIAQSDFLAFPRADLPAEAWAGLPGHVCRVVPDIASVRFQLHDEAPWQEESCNPMPDDESVTPELDVPKASLPPARSA